MVLVDKRNEAVDCEQNNSKFCLNYNISFQMWKSSRRLLEVVFGRLCPASTTGNFLLGSGRLGLPVGLAVFILILCSFSIVNASKTNKCRDRGRVVFNESYGMISDGLDQEYKVIDHCEWLIKAADPRSYIVLQFSHFETECSYDFLFVYDGASYISPLLASLSGDTLPMPVVARSGMMLIYLYSDTNYVLDGFHASYIVEDCLFNCSGNGKCSNHSCICNTRYTGEACQYETCPRDCAAAQGHGICQLHNNGSSHCECYDGYIGHDCSVSTIDSSGWGSTFTISNSNQVSSNQVSSNQVSRTAHGGVFHPKTNAFWMFGGFDMDNVLDDIVMFNFTSNEWQEIQPNTDIRPVGRRSHSVILYQDELIVFGGVLSNGSYTNELWSFTIPSLEWQLLNAGSHSVPVARADHSASVVEYSALYIFGGHSRDENFLGSLYKYDLVLRNGWTHIQPLGGLEFDVRVSGHSSVYHYDSKSLIIFGGFRPKWVKVTARTNETYAFHVDKLYWMEWENRVKGAPYERAFHTAVIMGNYMVVYGGNVHIFRDKKKKNEYTEKCYEDEVSFYHLGCHRWLTDEEISQDFGDVSNQTHPRPRGRFGHTAAVRDGNILLIVGGFSGTVLNDIIAIKVPGSVAINSASHQPGECNTFCHMHTRVKSCNLDPDCGWCTHTEADNSAACLPHSQQNMCAGTFELSYCPGICDVLSTCESCTIWGQGTGPITYAPAGVRLNEKCGWCVQTAMCTRINDVSVCDEMTNSTSPVGWWGRNGGFLQKFDQCRTNDFPPGLTMIKHNEPINETHPDEVEIIRSSRYNFKFNRIVEYAVIIKGFIYPSEAEPPPGSRLRLWLGSNEDNTTLIISNNPTQNKLLKIQPAEGEAVRADNSDIFSNVTRGVKYYMKLEVQNRITETKVTWSKYHSLILNWNGNLENSRHISELLTVRYLQPFYSSDCSGYTNCKSCLTDAACGWCPTNLTCELRNGPIVAANRCGMLANPSHHLILDLMMCVDCIYHINCHTCTQDGLCEWVPNESTCFRRGSNINAVTKTNQCSDPCVMASTCSSCTSNPDCGWCEELSHCFVYGTYTLLFPFGQCSHWFENPSKCIDCSSFTSCAQCLSQFQCGWCTDPNDHSIGRCMEGDFDGPVHAECSYISEPITNITLPAIWDYQECYLCHRHLNNCSQNATCIDEHLGFTCRCNVGFEGDGITCQKTCSETCVHGMCSAPIEDKCACYIGWTGVRCDVDCQCNAHSTCVQGVGICDQCQYHTTGKNCNTCLPGYYKQLTATGFTCETCQCNGHGDPAKGQCDPNTGHCHCKDLTNGINCQQCSNGLHGDSRNGGSCYVSCTGRTLLTNISSGGISSNRHNQSSRLWTEEVNYCLMVLSVFESIQQVTQPIAVPSISFTIQKDINIDCGFEFVTVYDGMPMNVSGTTVTNSKVLGKFCGKGLERDLTVTAYSGVLTVLYDSRQAIYRESYGFKALFQVNSCPKSCYGNRKCVKGECICKEGYQGSLCEMKICLNNCSTHGVCNKAVGLCICEPGFGGVSCSQGINNKSIVWTTIFDPDRLQNSLLCGQDYPCGRSGHVMLQSIDGNLIIFGGFNMQNGFMNDIWSFNTSSHEWRKEQSQYSALKPSPRAHTAACYYSNKILILGGEDYSKVFDDMWIFDIETKFWHVETTSDVRSPPAVAGHTLTLIRGSSPVSGYLLLIGGYSPQNGLLHDTWKLFLEDHTWSKVGTTGISPTGIYGHTTVYDEDTQAVYVFGGYTFRVNKTEISDVLYVFHIPSKHWSILPNEDELSPHLFHSAISIQGNMIVLGGSNDNLGFTSSILAYRYMCNQWVNLAEYSVGDSPFISKDQAVVAIGNRIYVYGGQAGISSGAIHVLDLPNDLCSLEITMDGCYERPGCSVCVDSKNKIYCYNSQSASEPESCQSGEDSFGRDLCNQKRQQDRNCSQATSCAECVPKYPAFPSANKTCKWCSYCPKGQCISVNDECDNNMMCRRDHPILSDVNCPESVCAASTCSQCHDVNCIWTNHVQRLSENRNFMNVLDSYAWNCYHQHVFANAPEEIRKLLTQSKYASSCPEPCLQNKSCRQCLEKPGPDSGWDSCVWSTQLNLCMSPTYLHLHCINGLCGEFIASKELSCPPEDSCSDIDRCRHCLQELGCGWCATGTDGKGVCLKGALHGSENGQCSRDPNTKDVASTDDKPGEWNYFKCPPENECLNDHHACFSCEKCRDTPEHYVCECQLGFNCTDKVLRECIPQCEPACKIGNGVCKSIVCTTDDCVNQCKCNFGFAGEDCSVECDCNGHSGCTVVDKSHNCTSCIHNTMGPQCQYCLPNFVGDPVDGGECKPCLSYCNGNSETCVSKEDLNKGVKSNNSPTKNAVCIDCRNNTKGNKCQECKDGFFKRDKVCIECICNGNCDTCDPRSGHVDRNACRNNTTTDHEATQLNQQCAKCMDGFVGLPSQGQPCYRSLALDKSFCLTQQLIDYETGIPGCDSVAAELAKGRTSFFHIDGKTDLHLFSDIQVCHGEFDVFIASNEYLLKTLINQSGSSIIQINESVKITDYDVTIKLRSSTKVIRLNTGGASSNIYNTSLATVKRDANQKTSVPYKNEEVYKYYETTADGVNNFVYITFSRFVVKINNVRDRLVIHFQQKHRTKPRYFIALISKGDDKYESTKALLRLAKTTKAHIDLFVFFSVFFSSFFILLSLCVVVWKIKLWHDNRLRFQLQTREMENRRSRPFGNVCVMIDQKRTRQRKSRGHRSRGETQQVPVQPNKQPPSFITIEPTFDDLATVCTVLMTLPGGDVAPTKACLGSALFSFRPPPPKIQDSRQKNADEIKPMLATYYSRMRQGAVTRGRTPTQPPPPPPEWL